MGTKNNSIYRTVKCGCGEYLEICDDQSITCMQCHSQVNPHPQTDVKHVDTLSDKHTETQIEHSTHISFNPFEFLFDTICAIIGVVTYFAWSITSFVLALAWELLKIVLSLILVVVSGAGMIAFLAICGFVIFKIIF